MSCSYGDSFHLTVFGQSHADCIGVVIDGIPAGVQLDFDFIRAMLARRAPGNAAFATARKEADLPEIVCGVVDGITCGAPLCAMIRNTNAHSNDYDALRNLPRPSHADFAAFWKHEGYADMRGGGNFSGRMTAPLVFAGAVAMQLLRDKGITVGAHIASIGTIKDDAFDPVGLTADMLTSAQQKAFPVLNDIAGADMQQAIAEAKADGDSVGGVIECAAVGLPAGIGAPMFSGVENEIARTVFAIPAVKGIEFGSGFAGASAKGSENNDPFCLDQTGEIRTATNHHGGILGGLTSGMPVVFRVAMKPTPSIAKPQQTVNLQTYEPATLTIPGRHDPCVVPRAVPCVEAACAIALINLIGT